jgi:hypothetical protein
MIATMLRNPWTKIKLLLAKQFKFRKYQFIKSFLQAQRQQRLTMTKWIILRLRLKEIIELGAE